MQRSPTPDEMDALYRAIGLGIWHLQHLEYALHISLTIKVDVKTPGALPMGSAKKAFEGHARKTLGAALKTAREHSALPEVLQSQLEAFLTERNWLVHRSIEEHTEGMYSNEGRSHAMSRLNSFILRAQEIKMHVIQDFSNYVQDHGVSVAEATARAQAQVANLRGEA